MTEMPKKTGKKFSEYRLSTLLSPFSLAPLHLLLTIVSLFLFLFLTISLSLPRVLLSTYGPGCLSISVFSFLSFPLSPPPLLLSCYTQPLSLHITGILASL